MIMEAIYAILIWLGVARPAGRSVWDIIEEDPAALYYARPRGQHRSGIEVRRITIRLWEERTGEIISRKNRRQLRLAGVNL